jgi:orotidine-5'-phosphate decarboxylase
MTDLLSQHPVPVAERLIVALDLPDAQQALALVGRLGDAVRFYKIGLELFLSGDYFDLLRGLRDQGKRVFCDHKLFDVPETVARAVRQLNGRGMDFLTVHGNDTMLAAAVREKGDLRVLAVTVLTSLDRTDLADLGFPCDPAQLVLSRARKALALGCDGVVSSGLEAPALRAVAGPGLIIVVPGIRPLDNRPADDQKRVVDVSRAFRNGADYIVVGRPIRDAADPRASALAIQREIAGLFGA